MKRWLLFVPLLVFAALMTLLWRGLALDPTAMPSALIDKPLPAFALPALHDPGQIVTQHDISGEVALLNVWATWCPPCAIEHPYLVELAEQQQVPIIGVDYKDTDQEALQWLERRGNPYKVVLADREGRLGLDLGVFGAPETYVLDRSGVIRYRHVGIVDDKVWANTLQPLVEQLRREASVP